MEPVGCIWLDVEAVSVEGAWGGAVCGDGKQGARAMPRARIDTHPHVHEKTTKAQTIHQHPHPHTRRDTHRRRLGRRCSHTPPPLPPPRKAREPLPRACGRTRLRGSAALLYGGRGGKSVRREASQCRSVVGCGLRGAPVPGGGRPSPPLVRAPPGRHTRQTARQTAQDLPT